MFDKDVKLSYDDVSIVPERITGIFSRNLCCNPYDEHGMMPIFAAPMSSVINVYNWNTFIDNKINVVIPRSIPLWSRLEILKDSIVKRNSIKVTPFVAFSMDESKNIFIDGLEPEDGSEFLIYHEFRKKLEHDNSYFFKICIDLANGHMEHLLNIIKVIKNTFGDKVEIMSGNIANPKTYLDYEEAGADYVRVSIGTGSACLTASNTGVFYPPFSLIKEMYEIRKQIGGKCKIIADGGIKKYRDIQKALIYADYVMIGGLFNRCIESAGLTTYGKSYFNLFGFKVRNYIKDFFYYGNIVNEKKFNNVMEKVRNGMLEIHKRFYGMSTKIAQEETGNRKKKTSEGKIITNNVEYTLGQWVENEESYLRSAMSYVNATNLDEYKDSQWVIINKITYNK